MPLGLNLLKSVGKAMAKYGIRKLAYAGGAPFGSGTIAENVADGALSMFEDVWNNWRAARAKERAAAPEADVNAADTAALAADVQALAQTTPQQAHELARQVVAEVAAEAPEAERLSETERQQLLTYLACVPNAIRRTLRRPEDPTGRTVPPGFTVQSALDLRALLPARLPRFNPGQTPIYRRQLVELLGTGAFGEVWKAAKPGFDDLDPVALKFCVEASLAEESLLHEARLAQGLKHPGIVRLLDVHEKSGDVPTCLEYEFVEGPDLCGWHAARVAAGRPPALDEIAGLVRALAEIVAAAHHYKDKQGRSRAVVHRDLKPANILIEARSDGAVRQLKVTDFGIGGFAARETQRAATRGSSFTLAMLGSHTPNYAPPQQKNGAPPDPRDDVHALGVIWYQLLLGDFSLPAPAGRGWTRRLEKLGVAAGQIDLLAACFDFDPVERPADAAELAERLASLLRESLPAPKPAGIPAREPQPRERIPAKGGDEKGFSSQQVEGFSSQQFSSPQVAPQPAKPAPSAALAPPLVLDLGGGVTMDLQLIPAGEFLMGSPGSEWGRLDDEGPQRQVKISKAFYMGKYEVTQKQWRAVMGNNSSCFQGDDLPVEMVSWDDCQEFCRRLSQKVGQAVRLPTEAEWEYACRAGTTTPFHFGNTIATDQANYDGNYAYGDGRKGPYRRKTTPVESFPPHAWGLCDMHGNVWEWCQDWYDKNYYKNRPNPDVDPTGPRTGSDRVLRGGSWYNNPRNCRAAYRYRLTPDLRYHHVGFRAAVGTL